MSNVNSYEKRNFFCEFFVITQLKWIKSYLSDRQKIVRLSGWTLKPINVTWGVPQGSHIGPILFILFMNDVPNVLNYSNCFVFADDLNIFYPVKLYLDALNLQRDLDMLSLWCQQNCLSLNINKCKTMTFHRKRFPIQFSFNIDSIELERVSEVKDLGVLFDVTLSYFFIILNLFGIVSLLLLFFF